MATTPIIPPSAAATFSHALTKTKNAPSPFSIERRKETQDRVTISKDAKARARTSPSVESRVFRASTHERQTLAQNISSGNQLRELLSKVFRS